MHRNVNVMMNTVVTRLNCAGEADQMAMNMTSVAALKAGIVSSCFHVFVLYVVLSAVKCLHCCFILYGAFRLFIHVE